MAITQTQRVVDLALAGWPRQEIAAAMGIDVSVVDAKLQDLTTVSSGQGAVGGAPIVVTGSKGANAALTSLLTALATKGLITDTTT